MIFEPKNLHFGINFLLAPAIPIDTSHALELQKYLSNNQIDFERTGKTDKSLKFVSVKPEPLEVTISEPGPQVAQLLVVAPNPTQPLESFIQQAETVCQGFSQVWEIDQQQIVGRDACVRHLYQPNSVHAFQFLWEHRLHQRPEGLRALGRAVLGGGLRFVMPPNDQFRTQVELKVESYLRDSRLLFVEMQFAWPYAVSLEEGLKPRELMGEIEEYCSSNVVPFITGESIKKGGV